MKETSLKSLNTRAKVMSSERNFLRNIFLANSLASRSFFNIRECYFFLSFSFGKICS